MARAACAAARRTLWSAASGSAAQAWEAGTDGLLPIPPLTARVTDLTQTLSPAERAGARSEARRLGSAHGNQLAVLMVPTTQPEPIEAYSIRVAGSVEDRPQGPGQRRAVPDREERPQDADRGRLRARRRAAPTSRRDRIIARERRAVLPRGQVRRRASTPASTGSSPWSARASRCRRAPAAKRRSRASAAFGFETILLVLFVVVPVLGGILRAHLRPARRVDGRRRHRRRRRRGSSPARS